MKLGGSQQIEVDGLKFTVRPQRYEDYVKALSMIEDLDLKGRSRNVAIGSFCVLLRISAWEGPIMPDDSPAECSYENKMLLFGQEPGLLNKIADKAGLLEVEQAKNGEASQPGSENDKPIES